MDRYGRVETSFSLEDTLEKGRLFGETLLPGTVVLFYGFYGAGKTEFIRGLVGGYLKNHIDAEVHSPSFTGLLVYEYNDKRICHYDLYRLADNISYDLFQESTDDDVVCIEWAEHLPKHMFVHSYKVYINIGEQSRREIIIKEPFAS